MGASSSDRDSPVLGYILFSGTVRRRVFVFPRPAEHAGTKASRRRFLLRGKHARVFTRVSACRVFSRCFVGQIRWCGRLGPDKRSWSRKKRDARRRRDRQRTGWKAKKAAREMRWPQEQRTRIHG